MYAIFLLAMLADVARARVLVSVIGDSDGGLTLAVSGPMAAGSSAGALVAPRRTEGLPVEFARGSGIRATLERWASVLRGELKPVRGTQTSSPMQLATMVSLPVGDGGPVAVRAVGPSAAFPAIFDHIGSPAP
jgi:hypothetical protein